MTRRERGWLAPFAACFVTGGILLGRGVSVLLPGLLALAAGLLAVCLLRGRARFFACLAFFLAAGFTSAVVCFHPALPPEGSWRVSGIVTGEPSLGASGQVRVSLACVSLFPEDVGDPDPRGLSVPGAYWTFYPDVPEEAAALLRPGLQASFRARLYEPGGRVNPDGYDFREELLRRGITVGLYGAEGLETGAPGFFSLPGLFSRWRARLTEALCRTLGEETGGYAAALLLGNRSLIPSEDRAAFSRLGIAHILSVSGFHVGVLAAVLALVFRLLGLPQKVRLGLSAVLFLMYSALCGMNQPVLRASLLLLGYQAGKILNRPRSGLHLLCACWCLLALLSPVQITGASFLMSFGAMFGLTLITPLLSGPKGGRRRRIRGALAAYAGAQMGILLPELTFFQSFPLLAVLLNLPAGFLTSGLILAFWAVLLASPFPALSGLLAGPVCRMASLLVRGVRLLGSLPGISLWTPAANGWTALGIGLVFLALCALLRQRVRIRLPLLAAGLTVIVLSLLPAPHAGTEYVQFSAGNADAAVLLDRDRVIVLDAGEDDGVLSGFLRRRRLTPDVVILTHLHRDHAAGLRSLLDDGIPVPLVCLPWGAETLQVHEDIRQLLAQLRAGGTEFRYLARGDVLSLPSGSLEVRWPERGRVRAGQDPNSYCLVSRLTLRGTVFLHTGDLDGMYEMYAAAPAHLLRIAHHGSEGSTSPAFLRAVDPQAALLSCRWPERAERTAERLEGIPLFDTARSGALTVRFTDTGFAVESFLPRVKAPEQDPLIGGS